jgi:hypothetical protein
MDNNTNLKFGIAICAFLAVVDVAGLAGTGMDVAPPLAVIVSGAVVGIATLAAVRSAWRQVPAGLWIVIGTRAVSALSSLPPFFIDAPTWVRVACAVTIGLTAVGIGLVLPYARRGGVRAVRTT